MDGIRIKDLQTSEGVVDKQFDNAYFPIDFENPNATLNITGAQLAKMMAAALKAVFHPLYGSAGLDMSANDLRFGGSFSTADFLSGLLGYGAHIDQQGNAELQSLILRTFLRTPELIKNRISVIAGESWFTENETVSSVISNPFITTGLTTPDGKLLGTRYNGKYVVRFAKDPYFKYDDILRGVYNYDTGFETVFLRVAIIGDNWYVVEPLNGMAPAVNMTLARQGNFTNTERQGAIYVNSREGYHDILGGVNSAEIKAENIIIREGNLRGLVKYGITPRLPEGQYTKGGIVIASDVGADPSGTAEYLTWLLSSSLGGLAYSDMVGLAKLDSTIIQGGYLKTSLIDTLTIAAQVAFINKLFAQSAFIQNLSAVNADFTNISVSGNSVFSGKMNIPFVALENSDAQYVDSKNAYLIRNNIHICCGRATLMLPGDRSYAGTVIRIFNNMYPPYTKLDASTTVKTENGVGITTNLNKASGKIDKETYAEPTFITILGRMIEFIGVPYDGQTKWMAINYEEAI